VDAYARDVARKRALTSAVYFPLRNALFEALAAGRIGIGELATLGDRESLERIGVGLGTEMEAEPAAAAGD
jgi:hypothetical protein